MMNLLFERTSDYNHAMVQSFPLPKLHCLLKNRDDMASITRRALSGCGRAAATWSIQELKWSVGAQNS
jgi:hypothetical protein